MCVWWEVGTNLIKAQYYRSYLAPKLMRASHLLLVRFHTVTSHLEMPYPRSDSEQFHKKMVSNGSTKETLKEYHPTPILSRGRYLKNLKPKPASHSLERC